MTIPNFEPGEQSDNTWAICPYCGACHGDCWEWLTSEQPVNETCSDCGKTYRAWAEYTVDYCTEPIEEEA
jgi:hypothetical protein